MPVLSRMAVLFLCAGVVPLAAQDQKPAKIYIDSLKVGQKGIVSYPPQVVKNGDKPYVAKIDRIIDAENMILRYRWANETKYLWLVAKTKDLVDDQDYVLKVPLHVSKTTKSNGRTLFYLEPLK